MSISLSARQTEIINMLMDGMTDKQIASSMAIRTPTMRKYIARIIFKLEAKNRIHAIVKIIYDRVGMENPLLNEFPITSKPQNPLESIATTKRGNHA